MFEGHASLFTALDEGCKLGIGGDNGMTGREVGLFERGIANFLDSNVGEEGSRGFVVSVDVGGGDGSGVKLKLLVKARRSSPLNPRRVNHT